MRRGRIPLLAASAFWLAGLASSGANCLGALPNADWVTPALLYDAVRDHGLGALSAWKYTQDNWLLSIVVPQLLLHAAVGTPAWLPALTGWLCFVGCCALCGLIAAPLSGPVAALALSATLLFATPPSLIGLGYLANPVSHNATVLWCLAGLVPAMAVLRGGRAWLAALTAVALLVATISDPWAKAAFLLPILLAACVTAAAGIGLRRRPALWIAAATLPSWLAGDHAFGLLPALDRTHFDAGWAGAPARLLAALHGVGLLLGILPGSASQGDAGWWVSVAALALLATHGVRAVLRAGRPAPHQVFLSLTCLLSAAATLTAFTLSALPTADPSMARLVMNVFFLMPIFLTATLATSATGRAVLCVASLLFVTTGLLAPQGWLLSPPQAGPDRDARLISFLVDHGLTYGYGSYWGSDANAIAIRSRHRVTIRPVTTPNDIRPIQPRLVQTFDDWYRPADAPAKTPERFVVLSPDRELCMDRQACRGVAIRSFGDPDRTLDWEGTEVMVWSHPIMQSPPSLAVLHAVPPLHAGVLDGPGLAATLWTGWTVPSEQDGSAWTVGERSVLMLPHDARPLMLCLRLRASGRAGSPAQKLTVLQSEERIASWGVAAGVARDYCTTLAGSRGDLLALIRRPSADDNTRLLPGLRLSRISIPPVR